MPPLPQKRGKKLTDNGILIMLYLYHVDGLPCNVIADVLTEIEGHSYATSTIRNYARYKYANRINEAKSVFADKPPKRRFFTAVSDNIINYGNVAINYEKTAQGKDTNKQSQKCYLFKFYDEKNHPIFTKIGTTINSCLDRLKQEIASYQKSGFAIVKVKICGIVDCGELPAEGLESYLRACFIRDFPKVFHKNDRFFDMDIPTEYFFTCADYYFNTPTPYSEITL